MSKEVLYTIEVNKVDLNLTMSFWGYIKYKLFKLDKDEVFKEFVGEIWNKCCETNKKNVQEAINNTRKQIKTQYKVRGEI